jgi:uncharacterized protein DUF6925
MTQTPDIVDTVKHHLADPSTGWNIGSMGAIAEFHQSPGEEPLVDEFEQTTRATARGAIRFVPHPDMRPFAYETLSPRSQRWLQGVAICLPQASAGIENLSVLTSLGNDNAAIRDTDRSARLFDMGLDQPQLQFCIRTDDAALIDLLEAHCGRSIWEKDNPVMGAILKSHPHRIAISKLGRVEVYQKIGGPETNGVSPVGPHTHVLPKLLRIGRTHSANVPIPVGLLPCMSFHPANPVVDRLGKDRPFDRRDFDRFQKLLDTWGLTEYVEVKKSVWQALEQGTPPEAATIPINRIGRTALRNALRQMVRTTESEQANDRLALVERWREAFDQVRDCKTNDSENPGH